MSQESHVERFDRFQKQAVESICKDFQEKNNGRFLLVIPTGGGKTFTAVKSINALYENGTLDSTKDRVVWTAHRTELLSQAEETFEKYEERFKDKPSFKSCLDFKMIGSLDTKLLSDPQTKLVVIDEAHHGAANSYLPIFERPKLGVLGLTATPTRHDGKPLEFERESYSVGFPDLVEMGVVLRPEVRTVHGGTYKFTFSDNTEGLEELNNEKRNKKIIDALMENYEDYHKVIIYVGTINHVHELYKQLSQSALKQKYESISYITGAGNSRDQEREEYFSQEKKYERSIIVNVDILTEGYDDPSVNTVVMARPTASKLIYMQSMGRAIRHDPNNDLKRAFIVEIDDKLPNIKYRIDNRWLYSDISDALEPGVVDKQFSSPEEFRKVLQDIYTEYNVKKKSQVFCDYENHQRYTLLLFKVFQGGPEQFFHQPILITNKNRSHVSNMFNFISERMSSYVNKSVNPEVIFRIFNNLDEIGLGDKITRQIVFNAMENAASGDVKIDDDTPWILFFTFRFCQSEEDIPDETLAFISDMINKDEILSTLQSQSFEHNSYLIKYPLPLASSVGKIVPDYEFDDIQRFVEKIYDIKKDYGDSDHRLKIQETLKYSVLPMEPVYSQSLVQIVREELKYFIRLD